MKKYFLLLALFSCIAQAELNFGEFNNLQSSVFTGDIGGYKLILKNDQGKITGTIDIAEGDFTGVRPLRNLKCNANKGQCQFTFKDFERTVSGRLDVIGKDYIFSYDDMEKHKHQSFLTANDEKQYQSAEKDLRAFAKGNFYADVKKAKLIKNLPDDTPVIFEDVVDDGINYGVKISYGNTKGFVDVNDFYQSDLAIITKDNTPFVLKPGGVIKQTLKHGTLLGLITPDDKWVKVSYQGEIGFVPRKAIVGQSD